MRIMDGTGNHSSLDTGGEGLFTLVIETSTPRATLALVDPDGETEQREFQSDRSHNALLFPPLDGLLAGPQGRRRIGWVLVGSGPGSYSGTRVGIAAAQGVAIAAGCPAVAVPSILAVPPAAGGASCLAIGDARRGSYWTARVDGLRLEREPELCDAGALTRLVDSAMAGGVVVFSFEETARFPLPDSLRARLVREFPDALGLWRAWSAADDSTRSRWSLEIPQPIYLKPPHITPGKGPSFPAVKG